MFFLDGAWENVKIPLILSTPSHLDILALKKHLRLSSPSLDFFKKKLAVAQKWPKQQVKFGFWPQNSHFLKQRAVSPY